MHEQIEHAIRELTGELRAGRAQRITELEWFRSHSHLATKHDLQKLGDTIMKEIQDFAARQKTFNDKLDAAVSGLTGDIKTLNDKIEQLQNTPPVLEAGDQALLNDIEARSDAIATKLAALDAMTPPAVPTTGTPTTPTGGNPNPAPV